MRTFQRFWWAFVTFPAVVVRSNDLRGHPASAVGQACAPSDGPILAHRWHRTSGTPASASLLRKVIIQRCGLPEAHETVLPVSRTPRLEVIT